MIVLEENSSKKLHFGKYLSLLLYSDKDIKMHQPTKLVISVKKKIHILFCLRGCFKSGYQ